MANISAQKHIGDIITVKALSKSLAWTAGGASDAATWTGNTIDRESFSNGSMPKTLDADVFFDATLGSGNTLSLTYAVQTSDDGSSWTDYATTAAVVVATGVSGGGVIQGVGRLTLSSADSPSIANATNIPGQTPAPSIGLSNARRYVRLNVIPDFNRAGTDTGVIAGVGVFAGFDSVQAPAS